MYSEKLAVAEENRLLMCSNVQIAQRGDPNADMDLATPPFETEVEMCSRLKKEKTCALLDDRLGFMKSLMGRTMLIYDLPGQSRMARLLRILRAVALVGLVFYQMCFVSYFLVKKGGVNMERSLVLLNWLVQSFISMQNLHFKLLKEVIPWQHTHFGEGSRFRHRMCKTFLIFWGIILLCVVTLFSSTMLELFYGANAHYDPEVMRAYGSLRLNFISYVVIFYAFMVWNTVMTLYVVVTMSVQQELESFNASLRTMGQGRGRDEVADCLLERYVKHVELGTVVRVADGAFEVYAFIMLGTNIPTTVFTLLSFYHSLSSHWYDVALSVPELIFCVLQIVGLTLQPARVYAAVREVESIVYGNANIWMPFSKKVYQIAQLFISHANQSGLGISLWGFAVVTKPLILTTTSLTLTYLTLLIQMNGPSAGGVMSAPARWAQSLTDSLNGTLS